MTSKLHPILQITNPDKFSCKKKVPILSRPGLVNPGIFLAQLLSCSQVKSSNLFRNFCALWLSIGLKTDARPTILSLGPVIGPGTVWYENGETSDDIWIRFVLNGLKTEAIGGWVVWADWDWVRATCQSIIHSRNLGSKFTSYRVTKRVTFYTPNCYVLRFFFSNFR